MPQMHLHAIAIALALVFAPIVSSAQESDPLSSSTSSTSAGGGNGGPATDAASTGELIVSPFRATEAGFATSSELTTQQLLATLSQLAAVMVIILIALVILVALGVGIYLTVRAASGNETAFRQFLRHNRIALLQQFVIGHGPVLRDFASLFEVHEQYGSFARLLRTHRDAFVPLLAADAIEGDGPARLATAVVALALTDEKVVREWLSREVLGVRLAL